MPWGQGGPGCCCTRNKGSVSGGCNAHPVQGGAQAAAVQGQPAPPVATRASWGGHLCHSSPTQPGLPEPVASCCPEPTSRPCSCHRPIRSNCLLPAANPGGADVLVGYGQWLAPWEAGGGRGGHGGGRGSFISHLMSYNQAREGQLAWGPKSGHLSPALGPGLCVTLSKHPVCTGRHRSRVLTRPAHTCSRGEKTDMKR